MRVRTKLILLAAFCAASASVLGVEANLAHDPWATLYGVWTFVCVLGGVTSAAGAAANWNNEGCLACAAAKRELAETRAALATWKATP